MPRSDDGAHCSGRSTRGSNLESVQRDSISFAGSPAEVFESIEDAARTCARDISSIIDASLEAGEICRVAFCGGNAARLVLLYLTAIRNTFDGVEFYLVDERCVAPDDPLRNDGLLIESLDGRVRIHSIPAERGPVEGASAYATTLAGLPKLDIVFLSIGADGHVASLFPDHPSAASLDTVVAVTDAPKPPATRVSLSIPTMRNATHRIVAAFGGEKAGVIARIHDGWASPAVQVQPTRWYLDRAAISEIRG